MKWVKRILGTAFALLLIVFAVQLVASESGEVVVITTYDREEVGYDTRLWIVELDGRWYLRAGSRDAPWAERLKERPDIFLVRGEFEGRVVVRMDDARTPEVNALMAEKYGWADRLVSTLYPRDNAIAIEVLR